MIEVQNLSKFYGNFCAVNGVSFSVKEGEIVGFLGPNGAGKTTTLRVLTCFHPATSGTATVAGHDVFNDSLAVRANIGYLPESVPLYTEMRAIEYLRFRGKLRGLSGATISSNIDRVATRCWIKDVLRKPIGTLSKGYRQRVGLADALLHNPKVLVLDEPTVGLDPTQIRETRNLIRELAQDHTVILSSHILPEVEATCQRIVIINRGRIVASGTTNELRERIAGDSRVIAEIKGSESEITAGLRQIGGVSDVQAVASNGWVRALVAARSDPREDIFRAAAAKGWPVRELRRETGTLEEFFIKIIAGQAAE
ncbi:MAG: ABC transporter ATP-binding protein [Phycisphaerae bacterium]